MRERVPVDWRKRLTPQPQCHLTLGAERLPAGPGTRSRAPDVQMALWVHLSVVVHVAGSQRGNSIWQAPENTAEDAKDIPETMSLPPPRTTTEGPAA